VQGGVLAGAAKIVAVDVVPAKLDLARQLGATHAIDASRDDPVAAIRDLTRGGADYTFEAVGNVAVIRQALDALGAGGALTVVGVPKLGTKFDFVVHALYQNKAILGCRYGTARPRKTSRCSPTSTSAGVSRSTSSSPPLRARRLPAALDDLKSGSLARGVFALEGLHG
jgi:S-(hydroxymethyl)glutathione dehydrogenase/alcohol dehydrogenase